MLYKNYYLYLIYFYIFNKITNAVLKNQLSFVAYIVLLFYATFFYYPKWQNKKRLF